MQKRVVHVVERLHKERSKLVARLAQHNVSALREPEFGKMLLLVHAAFVVAQLEVVRRIESARMRERFQVHAALDFQEVLLARDNAGKSVGTGVNLLRALFQVVRHGHHAQAQFAGHFHVARFEFGEFHGIEVSTLLVEHVVDGNHATPVVHLRNAVRTAN